MLQITQGQGGQRVAVPLKMLLQPQVDLNMCIDLSVFHKRIHYYKEGGLKDLFVAYSGSFYLISSRSLIQIQTLLREIPDV